MHRSGQHLAERGEKVQGDGGGKEGRGIKEVEEGRRADSRQQQEKKKEKKEEENLQTFSLVLCGSAL